MLCVFMYIEAPQNINETVKMRMEAAYFDEDVDGDDEIDGKP